MFTAFSYSVHTGEFHRQELPGPPSFDAWGKAWMVFRTTMLLLKQCSPEPVDLFGGHIWGPQEAY
eukprot:15446570-Alexandrium_andersonii.AAC.1